MLFGRNSHPPEYDSILESWTNGAEEIHHSIAVNLRCDSRTSPDRANLLDILFDHPRNGDSLMNGVKEYKKKRVQVQREPDFVVEPLNHDNIVVGRSDGGTYLDKDVWLVNVLDLNGLHRLLQWAKYRYPEFASFPQSESDVEISAWWKSRFEGFAQSEIDHLIGTLLAALTEYVPASQYQPTWVTTWKAMEPFLNKGADRWAHAVGVEKDAGRWLLLLRYPVRQAGRMAAPTQLDSGWYQHFFPTPPELESGHPMDLSSGAVEELIPEYIHCQIDFKGSEFEDAGRRYGQTKGEPLFDDCPARRSRHHKLLGGAHNALINKWMPEVW